MSIREWEDSVRLRLYHLRMNAPPPHRSLAGWSLLLRTSAGWDFSVPAIVRYEKIDPAGDGVVIPIRYIYAVAKATGVDPLWVLNWSEGGEIPDIDPSQPRSKGRPAARKRYKIEGEHS